MNLQSTPNTAAGDDSAQDPQLVARIILQQLGGHTFRLMTGAHNFVSHGGSEAEPNPFLRMSIGEGARKDRDVCKITLMPSDTYKMEFWKNYINLAAERPEDMFQQLNYKVYEMVYDDQLRQCFTKATDFFTSMAG